MGKRRRGAMAGKRRYLLSMLVSGLVISSVLVQGPEESAAAEGAVQLQQLVDAAKAGETVVIPPGRYQGPLLIKKAIHLQGSDQVIIGNPAEGPIIRLETDGATLTGLQLTDIRDDPDSVAVSVSGKGNRLAKLTIETMGYGVRLNKAHGNRIEGLVITGMTAAGTAGPQEEEPAERGNGIDLYESDDNVITSNEVTNMFDGVYIEKGRHNTISGNLVTHSRYGYHLMFSENIVIEKNTGSRNVSGAMVMSDIGSRVADNNFAKQSANATAQGLLLFDVKNGLIENNLVEGNRVGLFAQGITGTQIRNNRFVRNFLGIQMTDAQDNRLEGNEFVANVIQAQAIADQNNRIAFNYWDDHDGLDLQGDGVSDLPYTANPFFLTLTEQTPPYQIFFGSPGMLLLEGLFQGSEDQGLTDRAPWMKPRLTDSEASSPAGANKTVPLAASSALLLASISIIRLGGRRT